MPLRRTPSRPPLPRPHAAQVLLWLVSVALAGVGCASAPQHGGAHGELARHGLASATGMVLVPTVEDVMIDGNLMSWAEQAFDHLQTGSHAMALPYLEAALSSGQASSMQRAYLYWFKAQAHQALGQDGAEISALERFVLALDSAPAQLVAEMQLAGARGERVEASQARSWSRARLFALRIERGQGFGASQAEAVPVASLDEANLVLMQLRCGADRTGRVELVAQETTRSAGPRKRIVDVHRARCSSSGEALELFFDVTRAAP